MKTTIKKISDTKVELKVTLDADDLRPARAQALEQLAKDLKIQGFRKGKAPASVVERHVSANDIASTALDIAVRTSVPTAFTKEKIAPLAVERVNVSKYVPDETVEYSAAAEVVPEVKLGDYKHLKAKRDSATPSAKDIQEIIDNVKNAYAEKKAVKRAAKKGDEVLIDFTGKKDGVEFKGGSAKDHRLLLGSGQFIPGFEDGIIGHEPGDKFDIELTFPKNYGEPSLAGQKASFTVLLKQVDELTLPAEDDALAKKCGNFQNFAELKADIERNLTSQNEYRANEKFREDLIQELIKASRVSAPEILIEDQMRFIREDFNRNAASYGMTPEQYLERLGQQSDAWEKTARDLAARRVKASLILQVLSQTEGIEATDEEVAAKIAELKSVYAKSKEAMASLKKPEVLRDLKNRLTIDKTMDFLTNLYASDTAKKAPKAKATKAAKAAKSEKAPKAKKSTK